MSKVGQKTRFGYEMKFADPNLDPILRGEKTLTVRPAGEWRQVFDHDWLEIQDERGKKVTDAIVKRARTLELDVAFDVVKSHSGHREYGTVDQFEAALQASYPDMAMQSQTELRLIFFEVTQG